MSVLSGVTQVEERALLSAAQSARIGRVIMIEEGPAAAFGAGLRVDDPHASAVVDIGGGTTNVAIVANGAIVHARAERIGIEDINAAIVDHIRRHRGLIIGPQSAESLKLGLASATLPADLAEQALRLRRMTSFLRFMKFLVISLGLAQTMRSNSSS